MTTTTTPAKQLQLENRNNKFLCDAFIDINFAPKYDTILKAARFNTMYLIMDGSESFLVELVDYATFKFSNVSTLVTIAATGLEQADWAIEWLQKYPATTMDTLLAAYCYKRIK